VLARHLDEAARLLRPGGELIVFNWSYRGDIARDAAEARELGGAAGFPPGPCRRAALPHLERRGFSARPRMTPGEHADLWARDPRATAFQHPAWLDAWWTHLGGGERIDLEARDDAGRLIGALPAFIWVDEGPAQARPGRRGT
jgi:hypothetical protein